MGTCLGMLGLLLESNVGSCWVKMPLLYDAEEGSFPSGGVSNLFGLFDQKHEHVSWFGEHLSLLGRLMLAEDCHWVKLRMLEQRFHSRWAQC